MNNERYLKRDLANHTRLFYSLAYTLYHAMPNSYQQACDVDDLAQDLAAHVLHKASRWDPTRGGVTNYITTLSKHYVIDMMRKYRRTPNVCVSLDEEGSTHEHLAVSIRILREHNLLTKIQNMHSSLPEATFEFVESLLAGDYNGKAHTKEFKKHAARLLKAVLRDKIPIDQYMQMMLNEM